MPTEPCPECGCPYDWRAAIGLANSERAAVDFANLLIVLVHRTQQAGHRTESWMTCQDPLCVEAMDVLGFAQADSYAEVDICAHLGHDPDLDEPTICGRCEAHIDGSRHADNA